MNNSIQDEPVKEVFRPNIFGSRKGFFYFLVIAGAIYAEPGRG
jgi:hypothetical protein